MSRHTERSLDQHGGRARGQGLPAIAELEHPMDWSALVFRLARRRILPDLRGGRQ